MAELKNVELVKVGTWSASTGVTKITAEDLAAMAAAHSDQLIDHAPIKIGHDDTNAFNAALGDGEPAYGWLSNVAVGDGSAERPNRDSLYGDLVDMPDKLAAVAPKAFRRRSVEIAWGVKSAAGKAYRAVLTGLALLGAKPPAVKGLDDVLALYSGSFEAASASTVVLVDGLDAAQSSALSEALAAFADLEQVAAGNDTGSVPHDKSPSPDGGNDTKASAEAPNDKEGLVATKTVKKSDLTSALEALKDKAADEDVTDLVADLIGAETDPEGEKPKEKEVVEPEAKVEEDELVKTAAAAGKVLLDAKTFEQLSAGAKAGIDAATAIGEQRRKEILDGAIREGRISPAERTAFAAQLEKDEEGTKTLLSALAPRFATSELGTDLGENVTEFGEADAKAWDAFANDTFGTSFGS